MKPRTRRRTRKNFKLLKLPSERCFHPRRQIGDLEIRRTIRLLSLLTGRQEISSMAGQQPQRRNQPRPRPPKPNMRTRASEVATVAATDAATILAEKAAAATAARLKLVKKKRKADRAATAKKELSKATPAVTEPPSKKAKDKGPTAVEVQVERPYENDHDEGRGKRDRRHSTNFTEANDDDDDGDDKEVSKPQEASKRHAKKGKISTSGVATSKATPLERARSGGKVMNNEWLKLLATAAGGGLRATTAGGDVPQTRAVRGKADDGTTPAMQYLARFEAYLVFIRRL